MDQFYVKPAKMGLRIEDPETGDLLPHEGSHKPRDAHWLRQIARGDVVEAEAQLDAPPTKRQANDARG